MPIARQRHLLLSREQGPKPVRRHNKTRSTGIDWKSRRESLRRSEHEGLAAEGGELAAEGICRSSLDAHKPQNPINSEEYQGHPQGVLYST
eukprot:1181264-Prorocentrum_minimum.AAC.5